MGGIDFSLPTVLQYISLTPSGTETSTNLHQKLCYHVLGTDQSEDVLCAEFPDEPKWMGGAEVWHSCDTVPQRRCHMNHVHEYPCCVIFMDVINPVSDSLLLKIMAFKLTLNSEGDKPFNCNLT